MLLARVIGRVDASRRSEGLEPCRLALVETLRTHRPFVAVDTFGAVAGDVVVTTSAAAARMVDGLAGLPVDLAVVAVLDRTEVAG